MRILYLEPFDGGSHRRFTRAVTGGIAADWTVLTLPGRHWKWRMRGSAAHFATRHAQELARPYDLVFAGSYVALAELAGLCPALASVPKILYFHENQLAYPMQPGREHERDHHFGFTQLVSALAADACWWNSAWNRDSFLEAGARLLAQMPDAVPPGWIERIRERSRVLPVPLDLPDVDPRGFEDAPTEQERERGPLLLWNHRWEHDKAPDVFFDALREVAGRGIPFRLTVCGERYGNAPAAFDRARTGLADRIDHWGFVHDRDEYEALLRRAHVVVSSARHEFFGMSVLEAVWFGARPLVPDALAYPEHFESEYRYAPGTLADALSGLCSDWVAGATRLRDDRRAVVAPYRCTALLPRYREALEDLSR